MLPVCEDTVKRWPFMNQEVRQTSRQTPDQLVPCPNPLSLQNYEREISVVYKLPDLWYFAIAANMH